MTEAIRNQVWEATQISTSSCETVYTFNGYEIRLWIMTGGIPCLSFNYWPFQERYPVVEKYCDGEWDQNKLVNHWNRDLRCFDHQMENKLATGKIQGPTPEDCFADGWATFWNFYHSNIRKVELCNKRMKIISDFTNGNGPGGVLKSKRAHDKEEHTYVHAELRLNGTGISPVIYVSSHYVGRCEEKVVLFNSWWKKAQDLFNPIFDNGWPCWYKLSEEQFTQVTDILSEFEA
jgi:hypothetical protein